MDFFIGQLFWAKKNYKSHKPDSVFTLSFIYDKHYCLPVAAYPEM